LHRAIVEIFGQAALKKSCFEQVQVTEGRESATKLQLAADTHW
jgi:hypothetical protein